MIAVYDPSGKLGLTDPSPGGGTMPVVWVCRGCSSTVAPGEACCNQLDRYHVDALLLVTSDGTPDPIGMARAREALARVVGLDPSDGVCFVRMRLEPSWRVESRRSREIDALPNETAPEALARLLAEHAGCEVIRG